MNFQLVPPYDHLHNLAEKAIQAWKDHFVGVMIGTAAAFPVHIWFQSIPQAEQKLLLLKQSHIHPKVSEYAQVYGLHNYNAEPFMPIILETLVHGKLKRRGAF